MQSIADVAAAVAMMACGGIMAVYGLATLLDMIQAVRKHRKRRHSPRLKPGLSR